MWFKQAQLFQLPGTLRYSPDELMNKLEPLTFTPCLPSFPSSAGWCSPFEEEHAPLLHAANGYILLCLQIEEKILPGTVIRQELQDKIKKIEKNEERKVRQREKLTLKDEITLTLLPRAFSKLTRIYAYIDTKSNQLVLSTTNASKTEQFISLFKKSITDQIRPVEIRKPAPIMTHWLKEQSYPREFSIEKSAVLQDPNQQKRTIRCQQHNLFDESIQTFLKSGFHVKQLTLCWQDRINFILAEDGSLRSIQYQEEVIAQTQELNSETKQQQFDADFFIMTETLSQLFHDLLAALAIEEVATESPSLAIA